MAKAKKLILSLSIAITMMIALVVGLKFSVNDSENSIIGDIASSTPTIAETVKPIKSQKYTFKPGEVLIQKGGDSLDFNYVPEVNSGSTSIAYEYIFNNPMGKDMAVDLHPISATDVTLSYAYSDTKLSNVTSSSSVFEAQRISKDATKYIYIVVTGTEAASFSSSVMWYQGEAGELQIYNNVNSDVLSTTVVKGVSSLGLFRLQPEAPEGYNEDSWYQDKDFIKRADISGMDIGQTLYIRYHNLPQDWLEVVGNDEFTRGIQIVRGTSPLPEHLIIPRGTGLPLYVSFSGPATTATEGVFYNQTNLKSVDLPYGMSVPSYAFTNCTNLESVKFAGSTIGPKAFQNCTKLASININDENLTTIGERAFEYCSGLVTLDLSKCTKLTTIENLAAFRECTGLTQVRLPKSLTTMGNNTFQNCSNLTSVNLGECTSLTTLSAKTFENCTSLTSITIPRNITSIGNNAFAASGLTSVTIPSGVTSLGEYSFYNCTSLVSINLSACTNLTTIGQRAFEYCSKLQKLDLSNCTKLTTIGNVVFRECASLTEARLPSSLTAMGTHTFQNCKKLASVNLNNCTNLTTIGYRSFYDCNALTRVDLGNCTKLTTIPSDIFYSCDNLVSVILPSSVTSILTNAFSSCVRLPNITIPNKVTSIGVNAFSSCSNLKTITFNNSDYYWTANSKLIDVFDPALNITTLGNSYAGYDWSKTNTKIVQATIGSTEYISIMSALSASVSGDTVKVLMSSLRSDKVTPRGVNITSNCTVKSGVTLLLAYDANGTPSSNVATSNSVFYVVGGSGALGSVNSRVRITEGVTLTIEEGGTLDVPGKLICGVIGSQYMGQTGSTCSELVLHSNAKIISNGTIKSTGYIKEDSNNNGSQIISNGEIYLPFILNDFRTPTYMYAAYKNNVQPFTRYQILNITPKVQVNYSDVYGYVNLLRDGEVQSFNINVVGTSSNALYQLTGSSSYVDIKVNSSNVAKVDFYNGMKLNPLKVPINIMISITMTSEKFHFPIPWTFDISLNNGSYDFSSQDIKLFPGANLTVNNTASLTAKDIVVYETFEDTVTNYGLYYPSDKEPAKLRVAGELTCARLAGKATLAESDATITINNTGASNFNSTEADGEISGWGGLMASIGTKTITHESGVMNSSESICVPYTYTANVAVKYSYKNGILEVS